MSDEEIPDDENPGSPSSRTNKPNDAREGLFVSDAELYRRLGVGPRTGRQAVMALERVGQFPRKDPLFGNKRYWPAVVAKLNERYIRTVSPINPRPHYPRQAPDGLETLPTRRLGPEAPEQDRARYGYTDKDGNFRTIVAGRRAGEVRVTAPDGRKWVEDCKPTDPASWQRKRALKSRTPAPTE
jgi:hypothetical protein